MNSTNLTAAQGHYSTQLKNANAKPLVQPLKKKVVKLKKTTTSRVMQCM